MGGLALIKGAYQQFKDKQDKTELTSLWVLMFNVRHAVLLLAIHAHSDSARQVSRGTLSSFLTKVIFQGINPTLLENYEFRRLEQREHANETKEVGNPSKTQRDWYSSR